MKKWMFLFCLLPLGLFGQESPVFWFQAIPILKEGKVHVLLQWKLRHTKGIREIEVWRAKGKEEYERIATLPASLVRYTTPGTRGEIWRFKLILFGKHQRWESWEQKVVLPPRGVHPRENGRLLAYNEKFLQKALEMGFLSKREAEYWKSFLPRLTVPLGQYLLSQNQLSAEEVFQVEKGRKTWQKKENAWRSFFIPGIGPPPRFPKAKVEKIKMEGSPYLRLCVSLSFDLSPDDGGGNHSLKHYVIRRKGPQGEVILAKLPQGTKQYKDLTVKPGETYSYWIGVSDGERTLWDAFPLKVEVTTPWFDKSKAVVGGFVLFFSLIFFFFLLQARQGKKLYLRRIEGLNAIEEAIGRATEMGRPVLYVPGIDDIQELQTVASLIILSHVSKLTALYRTPIIVPCRDSVVMTMAEEVVQESALAVGRPDTFNPDNIRYLSADQFAYVAGVDGIMLREKPAANLYLGSFFAESLILAETGYEAGAIQVAGTANYHQLPFFIVACDFTIIGEEFYAASAYLSEDPQIISSIKAADYFKLGVILFILLLAVLAHFSFPVQQFVRHMVGKG